jgi:hypothetical protein
MGFEFNVFESPNKCVLERKVCCRTIVLTVLRSQCTLHCCYKQCSWLLLNSEQSPIHVKPKAHSKMNHANTIRNLGTLVVYHINNTLHTSSYCVALTVSEQGYSRSESRKSWTISSCPSSAFFISSTDTFSTFLLPFPPRVPRCFFFGDAPLKYKGHCRIYLYLGC